jgi:microcystin-dependent protein
MATLNKGYTFTSGDVVTPTKLNNLVDAATVTNIQTADIADSQITTAKIADSNVTTAKIANGAVTNAKLGNDIILVPAGAIMPFAMNSAPTGWLPADGAEYDKTGTYAALFAAIGTTHGETNGSGGAGTSHFRVPDLRGYFIRGFGTNSGDGTASAAFGTKQADAFQGHEHTDTYIGATSAVASGFGASGNVVNFTRPTTGVVTDTINGTPRIAAETRPRNIALLYCIKF